MTAVEPVWSLTDEALVLILHAESDIARQELDQIPLTRMRTESLGGAMLREAWLRETAVIRLISTVEAYTEAASERIFRLKGQAIPKMPFSWFQRNKYFQNNHSVDLTARIGWDSVAAGIDLRNCIAHGLGNLTDLLLRDVSLGRRMQLIDVTVGGNRMQLTTSTVPLVAKACRSFILDVESELVTL